MNRTEQAQRLHIAVAGLQGLSVGSDARSSVDANAIDALTVRLSLAAEAAQALKPGVHTIEFIITPMRDDGGEERPVREASTFVVPR